MQKIKHTLLWLCVLWSQELLTGAEDSSHDVGKTFEVLADKLFNTLLKLVLIFTLHLFSLLLVFVWLLSSSGVQLALRGSAVRKHIWESQLALADSTHCWSTCWQSCGPYLGSWQKFLAGAVRKISERCLTLELQGCSGEIIGGVGICPPSWHSNCTFFRHKSLGIALCALSVLMCRYSSVHDCLQSQVQASLCPACCSLLLCKVVPVRPALVLSWKLRNHPWK